VTEHGPDKPNENDPGLDAAWMNWGAEHDAAWFLSLSPADQQAVLAEAEAEALLAQADLHRPELEL
jgi:hypothetical protein